MLNAKGYIQKAERTYSFSLFFVPILKGKRDV